MNFINYLYYNYYRPKIFFPKNSYSTLGEDIFINNFFKNKRGGFYVDVGAYHPLEGSNTFLLYNKKKWRGINIDANLNSISLFNISRKEDLNLNLAASNKKGIQKIYFRKKINMLNTLDKKLAKIHFRNGFQETSVKVDTLNNILKSTKFKNKKIDFLNIDVEGSELNVLKSLNFKKYNPKLICVEIHNLKEMYNDDNKHFLKNPIYKFLIKKKYMLVWKNKFSYIFKK